MKEHAKILIIDDDQELLKSCKKILKNNGHYGVVTMHDSIQAEAEIEKGDYDLFISDLSMPGKNGMELLQKARAVSPDIPFTIFSAYGSVEKAVEAMKQGAFDFIEKPFKADRLRVVVQKSLNHRRLHKEKRELQNQLRERYSFDNIIGKSPAMHQVFEMIERVAEGESNITIIGESGTGKELVARSIHVHSQRQTQPFVPVNCGALPVQLFESELFGYEKGAFTGAYRRKTGLLEHANGGTFFLDEICELNPTLQVKLLRMLQEKKIRRVGGAELIDVNVRIISASNKNMEEAVRDGSLREDLYYRLDVISIHLPPLRERREDIPLLCNHFLEKYLASSSKTIKGITDEALACLEEYSWPGNVRELENVIERAITLAREDWITSKDLPASLTSLKPDFQPIHIDIPYKEAKDAILTSFEKEYLTRMLSRHSGNISRAAQESGVDRRTFHRLLNRHNINSQSWRGQNA